MLYNILCITAIIALGMSEANSISGSVKVEVDVEETINNAADINLRIDTGSNTQQPSKHRSCLTIKLQDPEAQDGFYSIEDLDSKGLEYSVYCDMTTAGGGWTLVASVHENNLSGSGRCTAGDKWSSEQGNSATHPDGDGNWENRRIFGHVAYATTDDYKSPAYFQLQSRNIMILQVPNDTPADEYVSAAHFQSHTDDGRLADYGGNLYNLFRDYFPLRSGVYKDYSTSQGPSFAVVYDKGTAEDALQQLGPSVQSLMTSGYIQFRAVSSETFSTYALCPVGKMNPDQGEAHYACIGSAYYDTTNSCGDFSYLDVSGYGTHTTYSASRDFVESTFMIFYR